jgi:hypothetical protein
MLPTEGRVLQGMGVSKVSSRGGKEFCIIPVSMTRSEFSEAMGSIGPTAHEGTKGNGFGGNMGKDIKRMGRDDFREVRNHSNAVPSIRSLV